MLHTAALVKRGRTYDYEDPRTTYRMQATLNVLKAAGIEPTITHGTRTYYDWAMRGSLDATRHLCSLDGSGYGDCTIDWPAWVTDEMFDAAYRLANLVQTERGTYNRREAEKASRERWAAAR